MARPKVLLLGSYGRGNVGDDAFLIAAAQLFDRFDLIINSADDRLLPLEVKGRVTTISTAIGIDVIGKILLLLKVKYVVYGGGDLWVELYGDRFPRQSLYKMALLNFGARLLGKKVFYVGCGAGALKGWSLWLARFSGYLANYVITRDNETARLLRLRRHVTLPDLTILLPHRAASSHSPVTPKNIGLSVMYYIPEPLLSFRPYLKSLARFVESAIVEYGVRFKLMPMLFSDDPHNDIWASRELISALSSSGRDRMELVPIKSYNDFREALEDIDFMVSTRLHGNILSILDGVPSIGIAYRPKIERFFQGSGLQSDFVTLDGIEDLGRKFEKAFLNFPEHKKAVEHARQNLLSSTNVYRDFVKKWMV